MSNGRVTVDQRGGVGKFYFRYVCGLALFPIEGELKENASNFVTVLWKTPFLLYGLSNVAKKFDRC